MSTKINIDLMNRVMNQILTDPKSWDQQVHHSECGTAHCFAGWSQILGGKPQNDDTAERDAVRLLGIDSGDAHLLFAGNLTIRDLYDRVRQYND